MAEKTAVKKIKTQSKTQKFCVSAEEAFKKHYGTVYRLAFIRTANKTDADDILSEVFLRLIKSSNKIKSEEHLKAWLIRATINCSNSLLNSAYRRHLADFNEACLAFSVKSQNVLPAVLELPDKQKVVVYMHYFEGYSVDEISKICSVPVGTVKSRLSRARDNLKILLEGVDL